MSGGHWNYQQYKLEEKAEFLEGELATLLRAIARAEHIIDWAESGDTVRHRPDGSGAERDLYDLWRNTFNRLYG